MERWRKVSHEIIGKVKALGFRRTTQGSMGAHLGDIYHEQEKYQEFIDKFLVSDIKDPEAVGDALIDVKYSLRHIIYHVRKGRGTLKRVINKCYKGDTDAMYPQDIKVNINAIKTNERIIEMLKMHPSELALLKDDRIKRNVQLCNNIGDKVKALGFRRPTQDSIGAILSDVNIDLDMYIELIDKFLAVDIKDPKEVGGVLVEVQFIMKQTDNHYKSVRRTLERVIKYCYAENDEYD
jgi:hypothetical protein